MPFSSYTLSRHNALTRKILHVQPIFNAWVDFIACFDLEPQIRPIIKTYINVFSNGPNVLIRLSIGLDNYVIN